MIDKMKTCQIATIGRNPEWIQLGLFRYPTDLLVLVTTENYHDEALKVRELIKGIDVRIETINEPRNSYYIVSFLKNLINSLYQEEYSILINITSGLAIWQLLFYSTATILKDKVKKLYIIDKEEKKPKEMVLYKSLTGTEKRTILSIPTNGGTLSEITTAFRELILLETEETKGSKALLSRYLKKMVKDELVKTTGDGRNKRFSLTEQGKIIREIIS